MGGIHVHLEGVLQHLSMERHSDINFSLILSEFFLCICSVGY